MKCLIIDEMHPSIVPGLESLGFEAVYEPGISRQEIIDQIDQLGNLDCVKRISILQKSDLIHCHSLIPR